jgi:hypothetical protein
MAAVTKDSEDQTILALVTLGGEKNLPSKALPARELVDPALFHAAISPRIGLVLHAI